MHIHGMCVWEHVPCMHVEDSTGYALETLQKEILETKKSNFGNGDLTNEELTK